ncbi:S1 family peptidase [Actinocrispum wychmicini]|uniref:Trypsin-like peptidase n=1 Tax=Actinocrispum wychmicini TaxID=1213861 RepID=A0A4R2JRI9_9PSEU|nr:serine protease [Actinocrispum wychmicini]TCO59826.1 trypsin-like peptidase [Actinocrispum wychmicini]
MIPLRDRVVEVLADRGPAAARRWNVGSGFLIRDRVVLTAAHVVADGTLAVRGLHDGGKVLWPARIRLLGDQADLALLDVDGGPDAVPPIEFVRIGRTGAEVVDGCWAVGFPEFKTIDVGGGAPVRETVHLSGEIRTAEDLHSDLLTLHVSNMPKEMAQGSPWSGVSGAAVVADGRIVGVLTAHPVRAGQSALTLTPITHVSRLADATDWWRALNVDGTQLPVLPRPAPLRIGTIPDVPAHHQHRAYATELAEAMKRAGTVVLSPQRHGLGGVGKTQLAASYARMLWDASEIDLVVWITATDRESVQDGYVAAAGKLRTDSFSRWLAAADHRWLVVIDDLADERHMAGLWPPPNGKVVVTTSHWGALADRDDVEVIEVGPFSPEDAQAYLVSQLGVTSEQADEFACHLDFQPLALDQAVSYIRAHSLDYAQYKERFDERRRRLPRLLRGDGAPADLQRSTVAVTWSLAVERGQGQGLSVSRYELTTTLDGTQTIRLDFNDGLLTPDLLEGMLRRRGLGDA